MSQATLSLCMIVRDEAAMLPSFLERVAGLWDELCVIDTGSVDETVSLLEEAGATVSYRAWDDDFAAARNASLAVASGTWILILDPDEMVSPRFVREVRAVLDRQEIGACTIAVRNLFANGHYRDSSLLRLFRRDPDIRFRHAIHEDVSQDVVAFLRRTGRRVAHIDGLVEHLGYSRERASERDKRERDRSLLERCIREDPTDVYSRFKLLEIARFWSDPALGSSVAAELFEAIRGGTAALEGSHVGGELLLMASRALHPGDPHAALARVAELQHRCQHSAPFFLGRAELRELAGDTDGARDDFERCLSREDPTSQLVTTRPLLGLARLAIAEGDIGAALVRIDEALGHSSLDPEALLAAVSLRMIRPEGELDEFLQRHEWSPQLAAALREAATSSAKVRLVQGRIDSAHAQLSRFVERIPQLGLGMLVCDLVLGRRTDLGLELDLEEASQELASWMETLRQAPDTTLWERFVVAAPTVEPVFPWLSELRS